MTDAVRLADRRAVEDALIAYAFHFDRNEPAEVGGLFADDAVVDYGPDMPTIDGRDALVEAITAGLRDIFEATSHHISNAMVTFDDDDSATLIAYLHAWHRYRDGSPDGYLWGQYHTRLRRTDGGWKFTELVLKIAGMIDFHRERMHPIGRQPA
jgi:hypothetical protein